MTAPVLVNPVPVLLRYLDRLQHLLKTIEQHQRALEPSGRADILSARLAPDMLPFASQVRAAARFALRGSYPLFDTPQSKNTIPPAPAVAPSLSGLQLEVADIQARIAALPEQLPTSIERSILTEAAGFAEVSLPAAQFLNDYLLPNFFFHLSMVYAIARQQGVSLSKADFDGYHAYPAGFTFE